MPHTNSRLNFASPLLRLLPLAVAADIACGLCDGILQCRRYFLPSLIQVSLGHAHRVTLAQSVPPRCVAAQSTITFAPNIVHNEQHCWFDLGQVVRTAPLQRTHEPVFPG